MAKKSKTTTFLLELPVVVEEGAARRVRAHLEAARQLYNAILSEGLHRLRQMCADPAWQAARDLPRSQKQARKRAFGALREQYGFSEYALHAAAKPLRVSWLAEHVDSTMAQTLATRAYHTLNRLCVGKARRVRFKSRGRGLDSVEGKRNDTGLRFALQKPEKGNQGFVLWGTDRLSALINWRDPVVVHGLKQRVKYVRLIRRNASSPQAQGSDRTGHRYAVQLVLEGRPYVKPKNQPGTDILGLDIGPSTLASVGQQGPARLQVFGAELQPNARQRRRLQRKLDRQRRANNPQNYDEQGRIKRQGSQRLQWHDSHNYQETRRRLATSARKLAEHRKSLHGRLVNELIRQGNQIQIEKTSFKGWQKCFGKSVGMRAPGMFVEHLKRTVAKTGGILSEISTFHTRLSQYCHGCGCYVKKPLSQRWHQCACGIGPIQRDLYAACLLAFLEPTEHIPSIAQSDWARVESRVMAAMEDLIQRAKAGQPLPQSFGLPPCRFDVETTNESFVKAEQGFTGARVRQPQSLAPNRQEPMDLLARERLEALGLVQEPPVALALTLIHKSLSSEKDVEEMGSSTLPRIGEGTVHLFLTFPSREAFSLLSMPKSS